MEDEDNVEDEDEDEKKSESFIKATETLSQLNK